MERSVIRDRPFPDYAALHPGYSLTTFDDSTVKPASPEAEQSPRHEDDHRNEDDPYRNEIILGEKAREGLAQQQEKTGADNGADQGSNAAHDVEDHRLPGDQEIDKVGRGETILNGVQHAGEPREYSREHDRDDLVALDRIADRAGTAFVLAYGLQHHPEGGLRDAPQDEIGRRHHREHEPVQRFVRERGRVNPWNRQRRASECEPVLASRDVGPGEDDDVEDLREDQGRDGEIDVAQARRKIGHKQGNARCADEPAAYRQPEVWRADRQQRGRRAVHAEAEESRVAE